MLGVPPGHEHRPHAGGRDQHAVQQPGDVGQRRGHEHGVVGVQAVDARHHAGLVGQAALGVEDALGLARSSPRCTARRPRPTPDRWRPPGGAVGQLVARSARKTAGSSRASEAGHLGVAGLVVDRRGDGAEAPAGPVELDHVVPVGELPRDDVAPTDPQPAEPAGDGGDPLRRSQHFVQRRLVPRPARRGPHPGQWVVDRRPKAHRPVPIAVASHRGRGPGVPIRCAQSSRSVVRSMAGRSGCASSPWAPRRSSRRSWPAVPSRPRPGPAGSR